MFQQMLNNYLNFGIYIYEKITRFSPRKIGQYTRWPWNFGSIFMINIRHTLEIAIYVLKIVTQPQLLSGTVKNPNILVESVSEATCITPRLVGGKKIYDIEASFQGHLFTGREEFFIVTKKQASVFTQQIILIFVSNQSYFINFFKVHTKFGFTQKG